MKNGECKGLQALIVGKKRDAGLVMRKIGRETARTETWRKIFREHGFWVGHWRLQRRQLE